MIYRFRKILERPDWNPPLGLSLEITYDAEPMEAWHDDDGEAGGVLDYAWSIVAIRGPLGQYHQPEVFAPASERLMAEPDLDTQIKDFCWQDYAERKI